MPYNRRYNDSVDKSAEDPYTDLPKGRVALFMLRYQWT